MRLRELTPLTASADCLMREYNMDKVKVLLLGLGNFGRSWAISILPACGDFAQVVAIVDKQQEKWQGIEASIPKYQDLIKALEETKPELVINVTPPHLHCEINEMLLRRQVAVLCEKPLADSRENAVKMGNIIKETNGFLMISQNYRYHPLFREARRILQSKILGQIHRVQCYFCHYHPDASNSYHGKLEHPLLADVSIHHLDAARYLTGEEPLKVWCKEAAADYCWYGERQASAVLITEMTGHVVFRYDGTLASPVSTTDWNGNWEIECDYGVMQIKEGGIRLYRNAGEDERAEIEEIPVEGHEADSRIAVLCEACTALREKRKGETDYTDNFKTFEWVENAILSSKTQGWVNVHK